MRPGFSGDFIPERDSAQSLGDSQQKWAEAFVDAITATTVTAPTVTVTATANVTGLLKVSGGFYTAIYDALASTTLTAVHVGSTIVAPVDGAYVMPAASSFPGGRITVITGVASAGTGVRLTRAGSDTLEGKTTAAGTTAITGATTYTNTGASDVVGDHVTFVSDGNTKWWAVAQSGTWA